MAGTKSNRVYSRGHEVPNAGRGMRSGDRSPIRGGEKGSKATSTSSQASNTPTTANPKTTLTPKKVTFGAYGRSGGKKR